MNDNYFRYSGEIVRSKDFQNNGGNVVVRGVSKGNNDFGYSQIELSLFLFGDLWNELTSRPFKYAKVCFEGHIEIRVHQTASGNTKYNPKFVCDKFTWL